MPALIMTKYPATIASINRVTYSWWLTWLRLTARGLTYTSLRCKMYTTWLQMLFLIICGTLYSDKHRTIDVPPFLLSMIAQSIMQISYYIKLHNLCQVYTLAHYAGINLSIIETLGILIKKCDYGTKLFKHDFNFNVILKCTLATHILLNFPLSSCPPRDYWEEGGGGGLQLASLLLCYTVY